jgi:hypothetical protein
MRTHPIVALAVGLTLWSCGESSGPSDDTGTLVVSTSTQGNDPDQDGYLLTVDEVDSLELDPTGTLELDLGPGRHRLRLLRVASQCSVVPGVALEVDVPSHTTTSVAFGISCPLTGARITVTTTGLDLDLDGYRVDVDGTDRGILLGTSTLVTRLDPGDRTIALTGLTPNCTIEGPASHTVTVATAEVVPITFAVVCTAVNGVIGVSVAASGIDVGKSYQAYLDGERSFFVGLSEPAYLTDVPPGEHEVWLVTPTNCSLEGDPQTVTVTAGTLIRDTVEVAFSVTCVPALPATLRITASTTGPIPSQSYSVWICAPNYDCFFYPVTWTLLGDLPPNGTLTASVEPGRYQLQLKDVPAQCRTPNGRFSTLFEVGHGDTREVAFRVICSS